jgi:hypothetical protein
MYINITEYRSKDCMAGKISLSLTTGSYKDPQTPEKSPSENCMFQPVITEPAEKSTELFSLTPDLVRGISSPY